MLLSGLGDRKKLATEIVISMGKKPFGDRKEKGYSEENVSNEEPSEEFSEYHAMAEELMDGIEAKDTMRIASTLKAFASKFEPSHPGMDKEEWGEDEGEED